MIKTLLSGMSSIGAGMASIGEGLSSILGSFDGDSQKRYEENLSRFTKAHEAYLSSGESHSDYLALKADRDALSYYKPDSPNNYWPILPLESSPLKRNSKKGRRNG